MSKFNLLLVWAVHWLSSVAVAIGLGAWAMSAADGGSAAVPATLSKLAGAVYFGLAQPAAYWILPVLGPRWWTWAGLVATLVVFGVNSGLVVFLVTLWTRRRAAIESG